METEGERRREAAMDSLSVRGTPDGPLRPTSPCTSLLTRPLCSMPAISPSELNVATVMDAT